MSTDGTEKRLRKPPAERFAGPAHVWSLSDVLEQIRAEDHPARDGHRQMTLIRSGSVTKLLFSFERDGHLDEHVTRGLVTIHVLEGRLNVGAAGETYGLKRGDILVLEPGLPHDVRAPEAAAMLLTVNLEPKD